jgi:hypothetical protein
MRIDYDADNEKFIGEYKGFAIVRKYSSRCYLIKGFYGAYVSEEVCKKVIDNYLEHIESRKLQKFILNV